MTSVPRRRVRVMNTAFRDGFQSVFGGRVFTDDFLPAVEAAREAGLTHFEAGGGARFQALYFYCNEDAFEMMDRFRAAAGPNANLQTLARGVNVVGLESQSSDVIALHPKLFGAHGITTIRNFDALNDVENLVYSGRCIVEAGLRHEVVVTMMELPPGATGSHTAEYYEGVLRQILDADVPYHSVCFKDASGTSTPAKVHETIGRARRLLPEGTELRFHTHETAGTSVTAYRAAIEAGVDGIDLSMAPCSGGTSQPDIAVMWHALRGTPYQLDLDVDRVLEAEMVFRACMEDYEFPPEALAVEPLIPWSPMPGGALTANTQLMRDHGILDRFPEVIRAMSEVVRRGGFGTSVTPVSQFYFQQAFNNVVFGPWERMAEGYGRMVLGYFGRTPVPPDPEIVAIASRQLELEPNDRPVLELNDEDPSKGLGPARTVLEQEGIPVTDENLFIAATCKERGIAFLKGEGRLGVRKKARGQQGGEGPAGKADSDVAAAVEGTSTGGAGGGRGAGPSRYRVVVDGRPYQVELDGDAAIVDGHRHRVELSEAGAEGVPRTGGSAAPAPEPEPDETPVESTLPCSVLRIQVEIGDPVQEGDILLVLEAMKMEIQVPAPRSGTVRSIGVRSGEEIRAGRELVRIG